MRSPEVQGMWGASWCITYTTYQCPLLLIIDYCYFKLYTTALHHYLSLIIATPSYALLHHITTYHWLLLPRAMYCYIMIITLTHRPTVLSGQQLPSAVALPLLQLWIICSTWLSRPPSPHNFGWWWSRESSGPDYAGKWRPTYWRPTKWRPPLCAVAPNNNNHTNTHGHALRSKNAGHCWGPTSRAKSCINRAQGHWHLSITLQANSSK